MLHDASDEFGIIPDMDDIGDVVIGWNNDDDRWTAATANLIEISHEGDPEVLKNRKDAALRLGVDVYYIILYTNPRTDHSRAETSLKQSRAPGSSNQSKIDSASSSPEEGLIHYPVPSSALKFLIHSLHIF